MLKLHIVQGRENCIVFILMFCYFTKLHVLYLKSLVPWCFNGFVRITHTHKYIYVYVCVQNVECLHMVYDVY